MFRPKPLRPPFDPNLGQPQRLPPTPTLRQLQMQAAHRGRGRGPGGWQGGGAVRPLPPILGKGYGPYINPPARFARGFAQGDLVELDPEAKRKLDERFLKGRQQATFSSAYNRTAGFTYPALSGDNEKTSILARLASLPLDTLITFMQIMVDPEGAATGFHAGRHAAETGEYLSQEDVNAMFNQASDPREALMAERDRLQQQLQTADEAMAQEIMAQIMEINKELEMAAAPGMAGGGVASLRGWQGGGSVGRTGFAPSFYQSPFDQYGQAFGFKRGKVDPRVQTKAAQHVMRNYWGQPPGGG